MIPYTVQFSTRNRKDWEQYLEDNGMPLSPVFVKEIDQITVITYDLHDESMEEDMEYICMDAGSILHYYGAGA